MPSRPAHRSLSRSVSKFNIDKPHGHSQHNDIPCYIRHKVLFIIELTLGKVDAFTFSRLVTNIIYFLVLFNLMLLIPGQVVTVKVSGVFIIDG